MFVFDILFFFKENKYGNGGVVFIRWGKKICFFNVELVYFGKYVLFSVNVVIFGWVCNIILWWIKKLIFFKVMLEDYFIIIGE